MLRDTLDEISVVVFSAFELPLLSTCELLASPLQSTVFAVERNFRGCVSAAGLTSVGRLGVCVYVCVVD